MGRFFVWEWGPDTQKPPRGAALRFLRGGRINLERARRFERPTLTLARLCSTPELRPHPVGEAGIPIRADGCKRENEVLSPTACVFLGKSKRCRKHKGPHPKMRPCEDQMERARRFERPTLTLARLCSTPELRPLTVWCGRDTHRRGGLQEGNDVLGGKNARRRGRCPRTPAGI